jgi:hypothetical protein
MTKTTPREEHNTKKTAEAKPAEAKPIARYLHIVCVV